MDKPVAKAATFKLYPSDRAALKKVMRYLPAESDRTETAALRFCIHETLRRLKET